MSRTPTERMERSGTRLLLVSLGTSERRTKMPTEHRTETAAGRAFETSATDITQSAANSPQLRQNKTGAAT